jgi:hypothetical protein
MPTFPVLSSAQVCVIEADVETGVILGRDGKPWHAGNPNPYLVFESVDEAREFSRAKIASTPTVECAIFGTSKELVEMFRNKEYWDARLAANRSRK